MLPPSLFLSLLLLVLSTDKFWQFCRLLQTSADFKPYAIGDDANTVPPVRHLVFFHTPVRQHPSDDEARVINSDRKFPLQKTSSCGPSAETEQCCVCSASSACFLHTIFLILIVIRETSDLWWRDSRQLW